MTLGCARNEVDSEELAARLDAAGWRLAESAEGADVVVVNTCGFIESAKKDSIDVLLQAADSGAKVVAAGCMAERYGRELADALPEAAAVLSFDDYTEIGGRLDDVLEGRPVAPHGPRDRRALLPITPVDRRAHNTPGHGERPPGAPASGPPVLRRRLGEGPTAPVKLASGCDRRCTFCAIPSFRGAYVSRHPDEIVREAEWLAGRGVREIFLVSENSSSYGKDLGDLRALEGLLPRLAAVVDRVRVSYLQPAEMRPGLIEVMTGIEGVLPYFDLSFQHASGPVLRRMRRYGDRERFLELLSAVRAAAPDAGVRSNFIVGFPGESEADVADLERFIEAARLDAIGVFGYSDEDGTEAAGFDGKVDPEVIQERLSRVTTLAEEVTAQRAEERVGATMDVLMESGKEGRAFHQAPETDGCVRVLAGEAAAGDVVRAKITGSEGVDLLAEALP